MRLLRRGRRTEVITAHGADSTTAAEVLNRFVSAVPITSPYFDSTADDPVSSFIVEASRHPVFTDIDHATSNPAGMRGFTESPIMTAYGQSGVRFQRIPAPTDPD